MKAKQMSAILAILIMLGGVLVFVPKAFSTDPFTPVTSLYASVVPAAGITGTTSISVGYPYTWAGQPNFNMTIYAEGLDACQSLQVGFTFNPTVLQCEGITPEASFFGNSLGLTVPGADQFIAPNPINSFNGIDNSTGIVYYFSLGCLGSKYNRTSATMTTDVPLFKVEFEPNPALTPSEILAIAGTPETLMNFSTSATVETTYQTIFTSAAPTQNLTPSPADITNSTFTITVAAPYGPTAKITTTPSNLQVYKGSPFTFSAITSLPGWDGIEVVPVNDYNWVVKNATWSYSKPTWNTTGPPQAVSITYTFPTAGTFTVYLNVSATNALTPGIHTVTWWSVATVQVTVLPAPTGCLIDLMSQSWRYVDPGVAQLTQVINGSGPGAQCELFRPGDLVELEALVTYGGAPVSNALVTFQVNGTEAMGYATQVIGSAVSNNFGIAEFDFRVPWPCTPNNVNGTAPNGGVGSTTPLENNVYPEFGTWEAMATWQCGSEFPEAVPFEKTQIDTMPFLVSWGLTILNVTTNAASYSRGTQTPPVAGQSITIKVAVENDYMTPITALVTAEVMDNLMVPVGYSSQIYTFPAGLGTENATGYPALSSVTIVTMAPIQVTPYAFVGTAYAFANLLTTWPWNMGTAFCPQVFNSNTFKITV